MGLNHGTINDDTRQLESIIFKLRWLTLSYLKIFKNKLCIHPPVLNN